MQRRELPTEPEIPLQPEHRDAALEVWFEHHQVSPEHATLLRAVVHGVGGEETSRRLGMSREAVEELELDFEEQMGQSIFEAASSIVSAALERSDQRAQVQI